jgi:MFS family permease
MSTPSLPARSRRHHGLGFWAIAFAFLTVMAFSTVPTPLWSLYRERDGFSAFVVTLVFAAYAVGVVVSLFLAGHVSDWYGRRRVLVPALVMNVLAGVVFLLWPDLPGLVIARVLTGVGTGVVTATATVWLAELHAAHRPEEGSRRPQVVATAANLGGIGFGALVSGVLAQWFAGPLALPYVVFVVALLLALVLALATPETRAAASPRPRYRPQRVAVPAQARGRFFAAATGALVAFAAFGLFTSLAPSFLAGTLHQPSLALAGAASFAVFGAAVLAQVLTARRGVRQLLAAGVPIMLLGLVLVVVAVWLPTPSLAAFLAGGILAGAGAGLIFKGAVGTTVAVSTDDSRAEALAGLFLAGYIGLAGPVVGLGVLTLFTTPQVSLLVFAGLLAIAVVAVAPALLRHPATSIDASEVADAGQHRDETGADRHEVLPAGGGLAGRVQL